MRKIVVGLVVIGLLLGVQMCAQAQDTGSNDDHFWLFSAQKYWDSMIRPGIRNGESRTQFYLDEMAPLVGNEDWFLYFNSKYVIDDGETNEQNYGVGVRSLLFEERLIAGANFFYDRRKSDHSNRFHQLGCGGELLSKYFDARVNGYFSLSDKKHLSDDVDYKFGQTSLIRVTKSHFEEPLSGLDYEVGVLIPGISHWIEARAYAGGFHYFSDLSKDINGLRLRAEVSPLQCLTFDVEVTDDNQSGHKEYVGGYVSLPFNIANIFRKQNPFKGWDEYLAWNKGPRDLRKRMTDRVVRDLDIISQDVSEEPKESTEIDGITFVDNTNPLGKNEDGTRSRPYSTIGDGINNVRGAKVVYVKKGISDYQEVVALVDGVTLWGSGYNGGFVGLPVTQAPVINPSKSLQSLVLAKNNTVMGCTIKNVNGNRAIYGLDPENVVIKFSTIDSTSSEGVCHGIVIENTSAVNSVTIRDSDVDVRYTGSLATVAPIGIYVEGNSSSKNTIKILHNNVYVDSGTQPGAGTPSAIYVQGNNYSQNTTFIMRNTTEIAGVYNFHIIAEGNNDSVNETSIQANVLAPISRQAMTGIVLRGKGDSTNTGIITENILKGISVSTSAYAIKLEAMDGSYNTFTVRSNTIQTMRSGLEGVGIEVDANHGGDTSNSTNIVHIENNVLTDFDGNYLYGIRLRDNNAAIINATIQNNKIQLGHSSSVVNWGVSLSQTGGQVNADLGNGTLGSVGRNSIFNNDIDIAHNLLGFITAKNNWWGSATPTPTFVGNVDYEPFLTSEPS